MIIEEENRKLYKLALEKFGEEKQIIMCLEEMSELQKELCKILRYEGAFKNRNEIAEEIADVLIMLEQVADIFIINGKVNSYKREKLKRLKGLL